MKIRNGFVSNSSTTSFCILGDWVDRPTDNEYDEDFESLCDDHGLSCYFVEYHKRAAVGMSPYNMQDDETLSQFKDRILSNMQKIGLNVKEDDLYWIEESYYY